LKKKSNMIYFMTTQNCIKIIFYPWLMEEILKNLNLFNHISGCTSWEDFSNYLLKLEEDNITIPIRLILTKIENTTDAIGFHKYVLKRLVKNYGQLHAALQIGPYIIDWNDTELCLPRSFSNLNAVIALTINDVVVDHSVLDTLSRVITYWNAFMKYDCYISNPNRAHALHAGNCQAFIDDILHSLNINLTWEKYSPIDNHLKTIKFKSFDSLKLLCFYDSNGYPKKIFQNHRKFAMSLNLGLNVGSTSNTDFKIS